MPISTAQRRFKAEQNQALATAISVINRSGVVDLIEAALPPKSTRGCKPTLPQYELRPILTVQMYLFIRRLHQSWANVLFAIWFELSDADLEAVGFPPNWRSRKRVAELLLSRPQMTFEKNPADEPDDNSSGDTAQGTASRAAGSADPRSPANNTNPSTDTHSTAATRRAKRKRNTLASSPWDNEYKRLWKFIDRSLAPINDTFGSANTRQLASQVRLANTDPDSEAARALRLTCTNALLRGALEHANAEYYPQVPAHRLHDGILRHHKGDLAVDEHLFATGLSKNAVADYNNVKQLSARSEHIRREQSGDAIGITIATTTFRPDDPEVPTVAIGMDVHPAVTGAPRGARNAIDAIETQGMRPQRHGTAQQFVIGDKAYPFYIGFTAFLLDRKYTLHAKLGEKQHQVYDLAEPDGTMTSGPFLSHGCVLCPGIGAGFLQANKAFDAPNDQKKESFTAPKLLAHQPIERQMNAALMPTNGRPVPAKALKQGRPKKGAAPLVGHYAVQVGCPAAATEDNPRVRCPIVAESMTANPTVDLPTIQNPPPPGRWPKVCATGSQRVVLTPEQAKTYNGGGMVAGTWDHQDLYSPARSNNEQYFNRLMSPDTGNLRLGAIDYDKNGPVALAIAMSVAATNLQIIDAHQDLHGNKPTKGTGAYRRMRRAEILGALAKKPRRNRTGRN